METQKYIIQIKHGKKWEDTKWTNGKAVDDSIVAPRPVSYKEAVVAFDEAHKAFPLEQYRLKDTEVHPLHKAALAAWEKISARHQVETLNRNIIPTHRAFLSGTLGGAYEMLLAFEEALIQYEDTEENPVPTPPVPSVLSFLCTGETQAKELLEKFESVFPRDLPNAGIVTGAKYDYRSAGARKVK